MNCIWPQNCGKKWNEAVFSMCQLYFCIRVGDAHFFPTFSILFFPWFFRLFFCSFIFGVPHKVIVRSPLFLPHYNPNPFDVVLAFFPYLFPSFRFAFCDTQVFCNINTAEWTGVAVNGEKICLLTFVLCHNRILSRERKEWNNRNKSHRIHEIGWKTNERMREEDRTGMEGKGVVSVLCWIPNACMCLFSRCDVCYNTVVSRYFFFSSFSFLLLSTFHSFSLICNVLKASYPRHTHTHRGRERKR